MLSLKENSVMTKSEYKEMQQFIAKISDQNEPLKVAASLKMYLGEGNILRIKVSATLVYRSCTNLITSICCIQS